MNVHQRPLNDERREVKVNNYEIKKQSLAKQYNNIFKLNVERFCRFIFPNVKYGV